MLESIFYLLKVLINNTRYNVNYSPQGPQIRLQVRLVSQQSNLWQRDSRPSRSSIARSLALVNLIWDFSPPCPCFFLPDFLKFSHYFCVCFFLLLHPCCSHTRGILCGIHTSCMGSPFHAEWSLVIFLGITRKRLIRTALN